MKESYDNGQGQPFKTPKRSIKGLQGLNTVEYSSMHTPLANKAYSEDHLSPQATSHHIKLQRKSNLATNLSIDSDIKVGNALSREERELQKLARILEIEKQRAQHAKLKSEILDQQVQRSASLAESHKRSREMLVKQRNEASM